MGIRDILVLLDAAASAGPCARVAAELAAQVDAQVVGAFARGQVPPLFVPPQAEMMLTAAEAMRIRDDHAARLRAATEMQRGWFEAATNGAKVGAEWRELDHVHDFVRLARCADLLVISAEGDHPAGFDPASLVMAAGGPALIVGATGAPSDFRRVLVGWNESREAARALRSAWPLIERAHAVDVVMVGRGHGAHDDLKRYFDHHGVDAALITHDAEGALAGGILRREATERDADLIVMGLYGRTRIGELILGGVSHDMLRAPPAPLFVCH